MKVLYIEDNALDADLLIREFARTVPQIEVDWVETYARALARLEPCTSERPGYDVVLTDIQLPDGSGISILSHLRQRGLRIAVVTITGSGNEETAVNALKAGASDYVVKRGDYLSRLPIVLETAIHRYQVEIARQLRPLLVLYGEHSELDVDLTLRHFSRYAPHIHLDIARSPEEVLRRLPASRNDKKNVQVVYDLLMLDFRMPGMNGLEVLKEVHQDRGLDLPVVLVTGQGDEEVAVQALRLGAMEYVSKHEGYLHGLPGILENVFHRAQLVREQAALKESKEKYRDLVELLPQSVFEADERGTLTFANRYAFETSGYTQEEFDKGLSIFQMIAPEDRRRANENFQSVLRGEISKGTEYTTLRKDGTKFPVITYTAPIIRENRPVGLRGISVDITERKEAEETRAKLEAQLRQAQKMEAIGTLAGGIAHDFNNILAAIMGNTEMALLDVKKDSHVGQRLAQILKASDRARELVKQILSFSRKSEQEKRKVKISPIIKEALKLLRASLPATIEIRQEIVDESGALLADPIQIHQVLMNLCTNAAHAMREKGGVLEVSLTDMELGPDGLDQVPDLNPGPYLKLTVRDTGDGISPEIIGRIFDPYFTTKEPGEGTGLGLAVVLGIVKSHGGTVQVESEPGVGTAFHLYFPKVEVATTERKESTELLLRARGNESILFVDDEETLVMVAKEVLGHLGYKVVASTRSLEALEIFRSQPEQFDLVITDQTMPGITGGEFAERLMEVRPDIPIIICTGYSPTMTLEKARALGIREFIMKPIVLRELAGAVRRVLDEKKDQK